MKPHLLFFLLSLLLLGSCHEDPTEVPEEEPSEQTSGAVSGPPSGNKGNQPGSSQSYYFPAAETSEWKSISADSLGWDKDKLQELLAYVKNKKTSGFIILHKGRIVTEEYWNNWTASTQYYVASAGKSITAFLIGVAQQEGLLNINRRTSDYLGKGWSSAPPAKEEMINVRHHLTMTTGLNDKDDCLSPDCFTYKADAGTRWAYHNAAYYLLHKMIEISSGMTIDQFTKSRLADKIGMKSWSWRDNMLWLSTRDMARFGLLVASSGRWDQQRLMQDSTYFKSMISPSNNFNKSYGYLWWLNGKNSHMIPEQENAIPGPLIPAAPKDMFAAMGKGDKKIYIVPSLDLVIARHGEDAGNSDFGPSSFDNELWKRLKEAIKYQ